MNIHTKLANGQCAHRFPSHGRCLELAVTTREIMLAQSLPTIYDIPLCQDHADFWDDQKYRTLIRV